jgi:hypothetical protein
VEDREAAKERFVRGTGRSAPKKAGGKDLYGDLNFQSAETGAALATEAGADHKAGGEGRG